MENGIAKKCLGWLAACALVLGMAPESWADTTETVDGVEWTCFVTNGTAMVTTGNAAGAVVIPESLGGYPVTEIGPNVFWGCRRGITSVSIPNSVTSIWWGAFYACSNLTSVSIGNGVRSIGGDAFANCNGLTSIRIPNSVEDIWSAAFSNCCNLATVTFGNGLKRIGEGAFRECNGLTSLILPGSVTSIGWGAFYNCSGLRSVHIPDSMRHIGDEAFHGCNGILDTTSHEGLTLVDGWVVDAEKTLSADLVLSGIRGIAGVFEGWTHLASVTISDGGAVIGGHAFAGCTNLSSVTISNGVTAIGDYAFQNCWRLTSLTIPPTVTDIGDGAFFHCSGLTSLTVPSSVADIGDEAFYGCYGLSSVAISPNVTRIGDRAFSYCRGLTSLTIPDSVVNVGNHAFDMCTNLATLELGSGVTNIGSGAFYNCSGLTSLTIPAGVTSIGNLAFYDCSGLTSLTMSAGVVNIGNGAFSGCSGLSSLTLPASVARIGNSAFADCSGLTSITIPPNVTVIEGGTFSGCSGLKSVAVPDNVTSIGESAFFNCFSLASMTIPAGVTSIGNKAFSGCSGLASIVIPSSVTNIGTEAFYKCGGLASVTISGGGTVVGTNAFYSCTNMTSLTLGDGVESIRRGAFEYCGALTSLVIPTSLTNIEGLAFAYCSGVSNVALPGNGKSIEAGAFGGCTNLSYVELQYPFDLGYRNGAFDSCTAVWGYSVTNGGAVLMRAGETNGAVVIPESFGGYPVTEIQGAFSKCGGLTSITIPASVANIGNSAFNACRSLTTLVLPDTLTSIGNSAFYGCTGLTVLSIPDGVANIGDSAFSGCTGLTALTVPASVTNIGNYAFYGCTNLTTAAIPAADTCRIGSVILGNCPSLSFAWRYTVTNGVATVTAAQKVLTNAEMMETLSIPDTIGGCPVTGIGSSAFIGSYGIDFAAVAIPDSVTNIGYQAFSGRTNLTAVAIGSGVASIGNSAFYGCSSLVSLELPDGVEDIGAHAFFKCGSLASLVLPDSLASIGNYAFSGCTNLASVATGDGLEEIGSFTFAGCSNLASLAIGAGVADIGSNAFARCTALESVVVPGNVENIGSEAFSSCSNLVSVMLANGVTNIGYRAFYNCGRLAEVAIPDSVRNIGNYAFYMCTNLASLAIGGGTTNIGSYAFYNCGRLAELTIPDSVSNVGNSAFYMCTNLASLAIGNGVTDIGSVAFCYCSGLTEVVIPDSVETLGANAFSGCSGLQTISVPGSWEGTRKMSNAGVPSGCQVVYRTLAVVPTELPAGVELEGYEAVLESVYGEEPIEWSLGTGYGEVSRANTFAESGTAQGWTSYGGCWELELPFAFPFYGEEYGRCWVSSHGTVSFGEEYSSSWFYQYDFLAQPMLAAMWRDLGGDDMDIWVESRSDAVTIRWASAYDWNDGRVNFAATLHADGTIVLSYGEGNAYGGYIGVSAGDGATALYSARSNTGSLELADDIVFKPLGLPDGVELTADGVLQGTPQEAGSFIFTAMVEDAAGATASQQLALEVAENPAIRPRVAATSPRQGYVNLKTASSKKLWVKATHPDGGALSYAWSVDGEAVAGTATNYTYRKTDTKLHTVRCTVSGAGLPRTASAEWRPGVLTLSGPEDVDVSYGQSAILRAGVTSSLPAKVTWYDGNGEAVGSGTMLVLDAPAETAQYHAEAASAMGTVTGRTATVAVTLAPSVGRVHKLTGAPFVGNRLVLRAKAYGNLEGAAWSWKRDGVEVATTERLDIASLGADDFGTYTLTVTTPLGTATSEGFVLAPAPVGVPAVWGGADWWADDSGEGWMVPPEGLTGVVQMAGGSDFSLALRNDGTVAAWGGNDHGACNVPDGLSGVSAVAANGVSAWNYGGGRGAGFAVKTDGSVAAWGQTYSVTTYWDDWAHEEYNEETGEYTYTGDWVMYTNGVDLVGTVPADLADVVKLAGRGNAMLALTAGGNVVAWGQSPAVEVPEDLSDVVDIALTSYAAIALRADGTVVAWGGNPWGNEGEVDVPADLADVVAVAAPSYAGFALQGDGSLHAWGGGNDFQNVPDSETGFIQLAAGWSWGVALDAAGRVALWGPASFGFWNDVSDIPDWLQGGALDIAAGIVHCMALVADTDGDSIADVLEPRYGRDPLIWEPWERVTVGGTVTVDGGVPAGGVTITLQDAEGKLVGRSNVDAAGHWSIDGVLPGRYTVLAAAAGAVNVHMDGVALLDGSTAGMMDFALEPGEGTALATVVPHLSEDGDIAGEAACSEVAVPEGTSVYLDLWPAEPDGDGSIDLGETAGRISELDGTLLMPHAVTVKRPETAAQTPAPAWINGREGDSVEAHPHFTAASGSLRVTSQPSGAEVWVDYADEPLGVTPLTVSGLAAVASHSHILLLKKDGCLRPRPIQFQVEAGGTTEIAVPLAADSAPAMTVAVDSAIPGMDIYVDYLPTGEVTPATVGGMDPAFHAGDLWYSASHSILLRHAQMRPFAPRAICDERIWDEMSGEWVPVLSSALSITAPNTYDDSDGDGVRNDLEVATGTSPFDPSEYPVDQLTTFDGNGGTPAVQKTTNAMGVAYGTLPTPKWSGHIFLGWFTQAVGGEQVTASDKVTAAVVRTLYAHWTDQQVTTFKGNGGKPATQTTRNTIYAEYGAMPVVTRSGQAFLGWFNAAEGGKRVYETSKVTLAAARTLYAHWTDRQVTTFNGNGGTPATQKTTNTIYTAYGTFPEVEWEGHMFLGWFNSPTEGKRVYTNSTVTLAATRSLYAHWTDQQVVTFKGNGGTPASKVETNTIGTAYGAMPTPKWSGHVFLGWFTAAAGGIEVTATDLVTAATSRTLYAHWTDQQVTTFLGNGGKPATQTTTNTIYEDYGTFPEAKWSGHALVGWFTAPEGGKRIYTNSTVTLAATRTLYAQWTTNQVTTFKGNGGSPATQKTTNAIYTAYGTFPDVAWKGHAFLGWFNDPTEGKRVYTNSTVTLAATRTLYAHWADSQVVTFKGNGGTPASQVATNKMGEAYGTLPVPKWSGHVFLGWFTAAVGGTEVTAADLVTTATARTLYAHWTDQQVTLFLGNGGKPATQATTNTIYADYGTFPEAKWSGHALVGWFNAPEGGKRVYTNSTVTLAATRTLYAQWTTNQVTTFKGNGGSPATQRTTNAIYTAYGAFPEVAWAGHTFLGWYNAVEGGKRVYTNSTVTLAATRTLYAHWSTAKNLAITGMSVSDPVAAPAARAVRAGSPVTVRFEAEAGRTYEIQWTSSLFCGWEILLEWTAETDGEAAVQVPAPVGEIGFYRVLAR